MKNRSFLNSFRNKYFKNPYILFLPALLFFIFLVYKKHQDTKYGDEERYMQFADNLIHGFYSPPFPNVDLSNGPGYPIVLIPFVAFDMPSLFIALMNALFHYLSLVLLFKSVRQILPFKIAIIMSLFYLFFFNSYQFIAIGISESFTIFLITLLIFFLGKAFSSSKKLKENKFVFLSGFILGYLALTKVIFGYVILILLFGFGIMCVFNRSHLNYRKSFLIVGISFITILPYLIYTYTLTNKFFYLATTGGNNMYWMSSPYKGEYGDWFDSPDISCDTVTEEIKITDLSLAEYAKLVDGWRLPGSERIIHINHYQDFKEISRLNEIEKDEALKKMAIRNIINNPKKYIQNVISNIGRLVFDYPYSFKLQSYYNLKKIPMSGIIIVISLLCILPTIFNWRKILFQIRLLLLIVFIYLGGSILASAETRMFTIIVPILLLWISFIFYYFIKIDLKFKGTISNEI